MGSGASEFTAAEFDEEKITDKRLDYYDIIY